MNNFKLKIILTTLVFFGLFGWAEISKAAEHYVSPTGNSGWAQSVNIAMPCSGSTAIANADDYDIVYFRGGTYNVGTQPGSNDYTRGHTGALMPSNSGYDAALIAQRAVGLITKFPIEP